jgi:hypothetical protein
VLVLLLVGNLRRPWLRRSQVLGIASKELSRDAQITKQESMLAKECGKVHSREVPQEQQCLGLDGYLYTTRGKIWIVFGSDVL